MELWRALMIPITEDSSEPNGFAAIVTSDPSPRTLRSSTIDIITTAALRARPHYSSCKSKAIAQSCCPQNSPCKGLTPFRMERSLSSVLSAVTENWISSENILSFLRLLSILTSGLKLLPACIRFRFTQVTTSLFLSHISYRHVWLRIPKMGKRCIDT